MTKLYSRNLSLPMGRVFLQSDGVAITAVGFGTQPETDSCPVIDRCKKELQDYCSGRGQSFTVPLQIPYGQTVTYGALAQKAGIPKGARAVGMACNRNPIAILIPCHRVVGSTGALTGYAGGLEFKRALLELEGICHG